MFRKLGLFGAAFAFFSLAGGQWAVLQGVAWVEMLRQYTQQSGSIAVAVEQTFDGDHPCVLCREITSARAKEQPGSPAVPNVKKYAPAKAILIDAPAMLAAPVPIGIASIRATSFPASDLVAAPPTPPPRGLLA